jgi:DNA-binding CsgD family transcriptional regulator
MPNREDIWVDLAELVDLLGDKRFERCFFKFISRRISAAMLFAVEVEDGVGARTLIVEGEEEGLSEHAQETSQEYVRVDYASDEILQNRMGLPSGMIDLVVQHPEDREPEFRRKYFDKWHTTEELSVFNRRGASTLYLGLCARNTAFKAKDLSRLRTLAPMLVSLLRRHTALTGINFGDPAKVRKHRLMAIKQALLRDHAKLTTREADICSRIVVGYQAKSIANQLDISSNTVATHRKRAYAKLGISSQTELCGLFLGVGI